MHINKFKKIVIKVGSSILIDKKGKPKKTWLKEFAKDVRLLLKKKKQIVELFPINLIEQYCLIRHIFTKLTK